MASLQLAVLAELVARLGQADGLEEIAGLLAGQARRVVPNDRCTLLVLDEADGPGAALAPLPRRRAGQRGGAPGPPGPGPQRRHAGGAPGRSGTGPGSAEDRGAGGRGAGRRVFVPGARSVMVLPLACGGPPLGTLNFSATRPGLYAPAPGADRTLLQLNVGAVVRNARTVARLRELNERTSRLVASVTHDYRSPLGVIAGLADLLLATEPDAPNRRRAAGGDPEGGPAPQRDGGGHARPLPPLRRGPAPRPRPPGPGGAGGGVRRHLPGRGGAGAGAGPAPGPRHTFRVQRQEDLPPVWGDRGRITQLLVNLLDNAVKYSPAGGEVSVTVGPQRGGGGCGGGGRCGAGDRPRGPGDDLPALRAGGPGPAGAGSRAPAWASPSGRRSPRPTAGACGPRAPGPATARPSSSSSRCVRGAGQGAPPEVVC